MASRSTLLIRSLSTAIGAMATASCEEHPKVLRALRADASASASASAPPAPARPQREGCARSGALSALEHDPSCVVKHGSAEAVRAALKQLSITVTPASPEVVSGGTTLLTIAIENVSSREATLLFEARPRPPGPRPDWSRVVGVPEPHPNASDAPKLHFPTITTDAHDRDVDQLPTVTGTGQPPPEPTIFAVHLRSGAKLTHVSSWWALRIPAPAPVVTDDAGHRYVPKTTAVNLPPGEYTVTVDLPLYGLGREERKLTTRMKVTRTPLLDGGYRRAH